MTNPTIKIHNAETGEIIERVMNAKELAQYNEDQQANAIHQAAEAAADATKVAEKSALLEKLGITADEAALLLS